MSTPIHSPHRRSDLADSPPAAHRNQENQSTLQPAPAWPEEEQPWIEDNHPLAPADYERLRYDIAAQHRRIRRARDTHSVPPPPPARPKRRGLLSGLFASTVGAALFALFLTLYLTDNFPTAESLRMALTDKLAAPVASFTHDPTPAPAPQRVHSSTTPRLIVEGASAENNREILIGASVEGPTEGATVVVSGLATGSTLSVGRPWGATGWIVPAAELAGALLRPPQGFSGTMEYALTLRGADNAVLERQAIRLDWAASNEARAPVSPRVREPAPANEPATPRELVAAREPAAARVPTIALEPAPAREQPAVRERAPMSDPTPAREVSSEEIRVLLKRGQQLLETGDLASARLLLRRAAEAGNATAAFALAASYDPIVLKELGVYGSAPDIAKAREWYEKAKEYGSKDAPQRLEQLASQSR